MTAILALTMWLLQPITVMVTPSFAYEPAKIEVKVIVENAAQRKGEKECVYVKVDGEEAEWTSSCWPSLGFKVTLVTIRNVPAGKHLVWASIGDDTSPKVQLEVLGP